MAKHWDWDAHFAITCLRFVQKRLEEFDEHDDTFPETRAHIEHTVADLEEKSGFNEADIENYIPDVDTRLHRWSGGYFQLSDLCEEVVKCLKPVSERFRKNLKITGDSNPILNIMVDVNNIYTGEMSLTDVEEEVNEAIGKVRISEDGEYCYEFANTSKSMTIDEVKKEHHKHNLFKRVALANRPVSGYVRCLNSPRPHIDSYGGISFQLFQAFAQFDDQGDYGSTGLGLASFMIDVLGIDPVVRLGKENFAKIPSDLKIWNASRMTLDWDAELRGTELRVQKPADEWNWRDAFDLVRYAMNAAKC